VWHLDDKSDIIVDGRMEHLTSTEVSLSNILQALLICIKKAPVVATFSKVARSTRAVTKLCDRLVFKHPGSAEGEVPAIAAVLVRLAEVTPRALSLSAHTASTFVRVHDSRIGLTHDRL
jgi:hypothetical protein